MKSFKYFTACLLACAVFAGCGLNKMVKKQDAVTYELNPDPMETYAGKMNVEVKGTFPKKYFRKKATMTLIPTIQTTDGATVALSPINLKGEKAQGDGKVISYKNGGSFSVSQVVPYNSTYENCTFLGDPTVYLKNKQADLKEVQLGMGTINTADRVSCKPEMTESASKKSGKTDLIISDHNYNGPKTVEKTAAIFFELNKDNLNWNLANNKDSKNKEALSALMPFIGQYKEVKEVEIVGWASPEGELKRNSELASNRSKVAEKWFNNEYNKYIKNKAKKEKVSEKSLKKNLNIKVSDKGEDWDGFVAAVQKSNIKDRAQIANVIKSQSNPDQREQQIRNMIAMYDEIDNEILPGLRRAYMKVACQEEAMTDAQIADCAVNNPDTLGCDELLYAASMAKDLKTKMTIYENAMKLFPDDFRTYNNMGCTKISLGQLADAEKLLKKANELNEKDGNVLNNLGVLSMMQGDFKSAASYFEKAQDAGVDENYNLAIINLKNGEYEKAAEQLKNTKCDYNVALSYLIKKDFAAAQNALNCIEKKTAEDYYLLAVVGARTKNANMVYANLKSACKEDPSLKSRAAKDMEFYSYRDDSDFQAAIK